MGNAKYKESKMQISYWFSQSGEDGEGAEYAYNKCQLLVTETKYQEV